MSDSPEPKKPDAEVEKKDDRFKDVLLPRLTVILSLLAIFVSLFAAFSKGPEGVVMIFTYLQERLSSTIIVSNIIVSVIAFVFLVRQPSVRLVIKDKKKFASLAELKGDANVDIYTSNLNDRVEKLVNQYRLHVSLFAFSLTLIYVILFLTRNEASELRQISNSANEYRLISYSTVATNLVNLVGALFVHCGFNVLYNRTLVAQSTSSRQEARDAKQQFELETTQNLNYYSNLYWAMPMLIVVVYALIFITLSVANMDKSDKYQDTFLNIADLLAGSYNGIAMSLLFGRYVSIEQVMRNTERYGGLFKDFLQPFSALPYTTLVTIGIVFILPIYALAQPLFGTLRLKEFGDPKVFQMWVFGICLVGKICFFHLTYILIGKGILHLYIYGLASSVGNFRKLETYFDPPEEAAAPADAQEATQPA